LKSIGQVGNISTKANSKWKACQFDFI